MRTFRTGIIAPLLFVLSGCDVARNETATLEGSPEEIAGFWAPGIREEKLKMIRRHHEKNREIMAKHPGLTILAMVKHGEESVSMIHRLGGKTVGGVTLIEEDGRQFLIEKLENDLELAIIEASFHE